MTTKTERKVAAGYYNDALDKHAEALIDREVLACQSSLIDTILSLQSQDFGRCHDGGLPTWDDCENLHANRCPDCGELTREAEEGDKDEDGEQTVWEHVCTSCAWQGDDPDSEPQEVLEWWLVSGWLAEHLSERGEVVLGDGQSNWWGRCCSGQSILLDGIMQSIIVATGWRGWPKGSLLPREDHTQAEDPRA